MTKENRSSFMNVIFIIFSFIEAIGWLGMGFVVFVAFKNMGIEVPGEATLLYLKIFLAFNLAALIGIFVELKAGDSIHKLELSN